MSDGFDDGLWVFPSGAVRERWHERVRVALVERGRTVLAHPANDGLRAQVHASPSSALAFYSALQRLTLHTLIALAARCRGIEGRRGAGGDLRDHLPHRVFPRFHDNETLGVADAEADARFVATLRGDDVPRDGPDWSRLAPEEIGFLYAALVGATPRLDSGTVLSFSLEPGDRRKRDGTFYTPMDLAASLADWTLGPLVDERTAAGAAVEIIPRLRVCDPAAGCGHFLLAAARYLGGRLAAARTFPDPPDRAERRRAIRDVIGGCLYGVERDPLAVDLAGALLGLEAGDAGVDRSALERRIVCGDSLLDFPMFREAGATNGFDAVLSNPPFGNAIEARTGRSRTEALAYKRRFPEIARGAYDRSSLFLGQAPRLLTEGGTLGLIIPRASASARGAQGARDDLNREAPPRLLWCPDNPALFGRASVFVAAVVARVGPPPASVLVSTDSTPGTARFRPVPYPRAPGPTWWSLLGTTPLAARGVPLRAAARAGAGCTTAVAYALVRENHVVDCLEGDKPRLVTTGALDRFRVRWGERPIRFLGRNYHYPRWPDGGEGQVRSARERQRGRKILVGGLTKVVEAALDEDGALAGVVGTLVVVPLDCSDAVWGRLLAVLNSAAFSSSYFQIYGARALSGGNCTIGKQELLDTPVPGDLLFNPEAARGTLEWMGRLDVARGLVPRYTLLPPPLDPAWACYLPDLPLERTGYWNEAERHALWLGANPNDPDWDTADARLHAIVSALYGLTPDEHERVYAWWKEKGGIQKVPDRGRRPRGVSVRDQGPFGFL